MHELDLQSNKPTNYDQFQHPLALHRMATFVRDAAAVSRGTKSKLPMVVVGPAGADSYCCCIGIRSKVLEGQPQVGHAGWGSASTRVSIMQ